MTRIMLAVVFVALAVAPAAAAPKQIAYLGIHPLPDHAFCEIEGPHVHVDAPAHVEVYVVIEGRYRFIGDPVTYGYKGATFAYHGHHPIVGETYCRIAGAHRHHHAPPPGAFTLRGGVYLYIGAWSPRVVVHHHHYKKHKKHKHHHHHHHDHDD